MHRGNRYYGHARQLAEYCGISVHRPVILGAVQHGWNRGTGFSPVEVPDPVPKFVWSRRNLDTAVQRGYRRVRAIGAPFLYAVRRIGATPSAEAEGTIFYPFHSWEGSDLEGSHRALAVRIRDREGPATVCLYWREFMRPDVVAAYEGQGHAVTCHGHRDDPLFLDRQVEALRRHRRMATNEIGSALFYAGALGLEVELYGPQMSLIHDASTDPTPPELEQLRERGPVPADMLTGLADRELGAQYLREPHELIRILRWSPWVRPLARALKSAALLKSERRHDEQAGAHESERVAGLLPRTGLEQ